MLASKAQLLSEHKTERKYVLGEWKTFVVMWFPQQSIATSEEIKKNCHCLVLLFWRKNHISAFVKNKNKNVSQLPRMKNILYILLCFLFSVFQKQHFRHPFSSPSPCFCLRFCIFSWLFRNGQPAMKSIWHVVNKY